MLSTARKAAIAGFVAACFVCHGGLVSLQPSFYPTEAESKGATAAQYGFVFGVASLAAVLFSPVFAHVGTIVGPKLVFNVGGFVQGFGAVLYGLLDLVNDTWTFIGLSYCLRFIEGLSMAACNGAILTILMQIFPSRVGAVTSGTEMFLGLGYMIGPVIGSYMYLAGGFSLPFFVTGAATLIVAAVLLVLLPKLEGGNDAEDETQRLINKDDEKPHLTLKAVASSITLIFPYMDNFMAYMASGMITSMLEPHMKRNADATQMQVAVAFLLLGIVYMSCNIVAGYICDRTRFPDFLSVMGNAFLIITFILIGPSPLFLPSMKPQVGMIQAATSLAGAGMAFVVVSTFTRALRAALESGFSDSMQTYLVVSGLWTSSFHLGQLTGSTVSGFVVDAWGFRTASVPLFVVYAAMTTVNLVIAFKRLFVAVWFERFNQELDNVQEQEDEEDSM